MKYVANIPLAMHSSKAEFTASVSDSPWLRLRRTPATKREYPIVSVTINHKNRTKVHSSSTFSLHRAFISSNIYSV